MSATTGIWSQATSPQANPMLNTKAMTDSSGSSSDTNDATISANDFLTLLVTEMQNQDPTSDTDPNEYIDQLVNVNSLEQLISINQTLTTAFTGSTSTSGSTGTDSGGDATSPISGIQQSVGSIGSASTQSI